MRCDAKASRVPASAHAKTRLLFILALITAVALTGAVVTLSLYRPINGDEAYNLQIAKSIGSHFCYCTRYRPERVFPVEESTNGIAQYVAGAMFAVTTNPDIVKTVTCALAMATLCAALIMLDPWLVFLTAFLFGIWPSFVYVSINFLGEVWAIAFLAFGVAAMRRCDLSLRLAALLKTPHAIAAIICFAVAAESKLLAAMVSIPVTFAIAYGQNDVDAGWRRLWKALTVSAAFTTGTALALLAFIAFSVVHSTRALDPSVIWRTFAGFIVDMISQGQGVHGTSGLSWLTAFDTPVVLVLFAASSIVLLYANWSYAFFVSLSFTWWIRYGASERHLVICGAAAIVLAALEAHAILGRARRRWNIGVSPRSSVVATTLVVMVTVACVASIAVVDAPARIKRFPHRTHVVGTAEGRLRYSSRLVDLLRRERFVATSGWWQFPELSLRENLEFYDRMSPANASLPRSEVVLLFDKGNTLWPRTSVRGNCERVLYTDGPLVLCRARTSVPLDFQPEG